MQTRGSIGVPAVRWLTIRRSTTTSDSAHACVHVAAADRPLVDLVGPELRVDERGAVLERLLGVDDHRQRVVVDEHLLGGVDHGVLVLADHDGDALADVLDLVLGQRPVLGRS